MSGWDSCFTDHGDANFNESACSQQVLVQFT